MFLSDLIGSDPINVLLAVYDVLVVNVALYLGFGCVLRAESRGFTDEMLLFFS